MSLVGYIRVSTDMQEDGLEVQKNALFEWAKKHNKTLTYIFEDINVSGALCFSKRQGLLQAIQLLKKGDVLLVQRRDRLGRELYVITTIEYQVKKRGARIVSTSGEGTDSNDPASKMLSAMVDVFSSYERDVITTRIKLAMLAKKKRGEVVGYVPYGKKRTDGNILVDNEQEKKVIAYILKLEKEGTSHTRIAQKLLKKGIVNRKGEKWHKSSLQRLIKINRIDTK